MKRRAIDKNDILIQQFFHIIHIYQITFLDSQHILEDMLRIQKSYLVNVNYVEKLLDQDVVLIDGTTLHFPKYLRNEVRKNYLRKRGGF